MIEVLNPRVVLLHQFEILTGLCQSFLRLHDILDAGAIDELHLMVAPIVLGSGKTGLNLKPISELDEAMRPLVRTLRFKDGDMLCMCDMRMSNAA